MELQTGMLSTLADCYLSDITQTLRWRHSSYGNIYDVFGTCIEAWQTV